MIWIAWLLKFWAIFNHVLNWFPLAFQGLQLAGVTTVEAFQLRMKSQLEAVIVKLGLVGDLQAPAPTAESF